MLVLLSSCLLFLPWLVQYNCYFNVQKADKEFITSLISLLHNIRRVMELHQDLAGKVQNYPELITGTFDGIKVISPSCLDAL